MITAMTFLPGHQQDPGPSSPIPHPEVPKPEPGSAPGNPLPPQAPDEDELPVPPVFPTAGLINEIASLPHLADHILQWNAISAD